MLGWLLCLLGNAERSMILTDTPVFVPAVQEIMVTAVGILLQSFHHACLERVLFDVAHQGVEIGFIGNIPLFEASLPKMPGSFIFFVEVDRVVHVELSHEFGKVGVADLHEEMVVVSHEAVVVESDIVTSCQRAHQFFEIFVILFVAKDRHFIDASIDDVIIPGYFDARLSWHGHSLGKDSAVSLKLSLSPDLTLHEKVV